MLIRSLYHILKLDAAWSKLACTNMAVMHALLSLTRGFISGSLRKLWCLCPSGISIQAKPMPKKKKMKEKWYPKSPVDKLRVYANLFWPLVVPSRAVTDTLLPPG